MGWVPTEEGLLDLAERAARTAGHELMSRWGREPVGVRTKSSPTDPVSAADLAAERAIREVIGAERPDDAILGEEGGESHAGGGLRWVVDPLDGTVNFLYGIPLFAVSVACEDGDGTIVGVVLDPVREECYAASRSGLATLNGESLQGERGEVLSQSLVATGFAYDPEIRAAQARVIQRLLPSVRDIRRGGAAALDLCWCACGRVDAYFERGVHLWDVAAGALLCTRAGLSLRRLAPVADSAGGAAPLPDGLLVAAPGIIDELERLVAE